MCGGCLANQYSLAKAEACETCPDNTRSAPLSTALEKCSCLSGYTGPHGAECTACVPGTYKMGTGSGGCSQCANGTYNPDSGRSSRCNWCTDNSDSPESSTSAGQCACNAGAEPSGGGTTCALCSAGSYKIPTGADACTECTAGSHIATPGATTNVCQCNAGWTGAQGAVCSECDAGTYKEGSGCVRPVRKRQVLGRRCRASRRHVPVVRRGENHGRVRRARDRVPVRGVCCGHIHRTPGGQHGVHSVSCRHRLAAAGRNLLQRLRAVQRDAGRRRQLVSVYDV